MHSTSDTGTESADSHRRTMARDANRMRRTRQRARSQPVTVLEGNTVDPVTNTMANAREGAVGNEGDQRVLPENEENEMGISNQAVDLNVAESVDIHCDHERGHSIDLGILDEANRFGREPPRKRRRTTASCSNCKKILRLKVKLLDSSLQQKENIIGHYNTLIHQKDSVVDQKDGVIRQKDDLIDTYKSIVNMGHRQ